MSDAGGPRRDAAPSGATTDGGGCVVFLIAETPGMKVSVAEGTKSKAETIGTALNSLLRQLAELAGVPDLDVAIVGYRGDEHGGVDVGCRWGGALQGRMFVPCGELTEKVLRVEQRVRRIPAPGGIGVAHEQAVDFPVWYAPALGGPASPTAGYEYCQALLSSRLADRKPPLLVSLVDEVPADGSLSTAVWELYGLDLPAGPPIIYHAHLSSSARVPPILCPSAGSHLPPGAVREIFACTSYLTEPLAAGIRSAGLNVNQGARGMIHHATMADLIRFLATVRAYAQSPPPAASRQPEAAALVLLLLDRSVEDPTADEARRVWGKLQRQANDLLGEISKQADGRLSVGVVAYGVDAVGQPDVLIGLPGAPADRPLVADTDLTGSETRTEEYTEKVSNGIGGLVELRRKRPIYLELEPTAADVAALRTGVEAASALVAQWHGQHPDAAVAPVVLHWTRGRWDPESVEGALGPLEALAGSTPGVLLYHVVVSDSPHRSLAYPGDPAGIERPELAKLWEKSSPVLGAARLAAQKRRVTPRSRGIVINGKFDLLLESIAGAMPGP